MDLHRSRTNYAIRALLAVAWVPYLIVQCTACPATATSLARCIGCAEVEHPDHNGDAGPANDGHDGHGGHHADDTAASATGHAAAGEHQHAPGSDCCSALKTRATTLAGQVVVPAPPAITLPWAMPDRAPGATMRLSRPAPVEPHQNSPPIYLACLALLL